MSPRIITTADEVRHQTRAAHARGNRVGLVPTRGDLHAGHGAIIRRAAAQCDLVVCSIVRPDGTPAVRERHDETIVDAAGADLLWRPAPGPLVANATVEIRPLAEPRLAPLATAAAQQLGIVRPDVVYVGDEHFTHARLLRDVARDLLLDVEVRVVPTPRDPDGIPLGVASEHLHDGARDSARAIPGALDAVEASARHGERSLFRLRARAEAVLAGGGRSLRVADVATVDPQTFDPVDVFDRDVLFVIHASVDDVPLVDSRLLSIDASPHQ